MKKLLTVVSILFVLGAAYGVFLFTKKTPSLEKVAPDYTLTADALFNAFDTDESAALLTYEGKVIQVTGDVFMVTQTDSISNIVLHAEDALMGGVNCSFNTLNTDIQSNARITVKGRCQGYLASVILNNCILVE